MKNESNTAPFVSVPSFRAHSMVQAPIQQETTRLFECALPVIDPRLVKRSVKQFNLKRYVAKETAIGVVINLFLATVPFVIFSTAWADPVSRPVREVAISFVPQFFMAAFMSALVPLMMTCRNQWKGQLGSWSPGVRLQPWRALVIALALATASTTVTLGFIYFVLEPIAVAGLKAGAALTLSGVQAGLAAAVVTPTAILLLLRPVTRSNS